MEQNLRWADFLPLVFFAWGTRLLGITTTGDTWAHAFYLGTLLAVIQMGYIAYRNLRIDYLALGVNLYLIYGAIGYMLHSPLLFPYGLFKQSGIFVFMVVTGVVLTVVTPEGFLQLPQSVHQQSLIGSLGLLALTSAALVLSFCLVNYIGFGTSFGVGIPFILLIAARESLYGRFAQKSSRY